MRQPSLAVTTLLLVSTASAQSGIPTIDPVKAKFLMAICNYDYRVKTFATRRTVHGVVSPEFDLTSDSSVASLLQAAAAFVQQSCPSSYPFHKIEVVLIQGTPAAFRDPTTIMDYMRGGTFPDSAVLGTAAPATEEPYKSRLTWARITNGPKQLALQRIAEAARRRVADSLEQVERLAEARARELKRAQRQRILGRYGAVQINISALKANPYVYKDKIVAVLTRFQAMRSASVALFGGDELAPDLVVISTPSTTFSDNRLVLLIAKVLGQSQETILGSRTSVPLLSFAGAYFCQQAGCAEISP